MTTCPGREQLSSLLSGREGVGARSEIEAHAHSCPECRALLGAFLEVHAMGRGPDDGETIARTADSIGGTAATWSGPAPGAGADPIRGGSGTSATIQGNGPADLADVEPTLAGREAGAPDETAADLHGLGAAPPAETMAFDPPARTAAALPVAAAPAETMAFDPPARMSAASPVAAPPEATIDGPQAGWSGATTDFGPPSPRPGRAADPAGLGPGSGETTDLGGWPPRSDETTDAGGGAPSAAATLRDPAASAARGPRRGPPHYEILGELGRGGMGVVYKALDERLHRLVALKMIRGADHAGEVQLARFRIEAEAVASLRHPNILQIYEIGESDGSPYVALELLEGGSLLDRLKGTTVPPQQAARWMIELAQAMEAAHRTGIIHRDLKSANILFSADGVPKITDFGLAKRLEADEGQTQTGQVMGTPSYMAPEQARGDTKTVGPLADVYALGAILYEMLTGRPPFKGVSAMDTVKQVIDTDPVSPSRILVRVPRDLETICLKCLQKEPRRRYASAKELADDLQCYLDGKPILGRRTPPVERAYKWARRHSTVATLLVLGILSSIGAIVAGVRYSNQLEAQKRQAAAHEAAVRDETEKDLFHAQEVVSKGHDLEGGRVVLATRKAILEREDLRGLAGLHDRTALMLADVERGLAAERAREAEQKAKDEVQARYRRFLDRRKEALFRDTQFTGLMLPTNLDLERKAAEEALGVFGRPGPGGDWAMGDLSALSSDERAEVVEGSYELLLVLSEAVAAQDPAQAERALRILDSALRLRPAPTRAYRLRRASCLARKGDRAGEARELAEAGRIPLESASDHYLSGQQLYKRGKFAEAIQDFDAALQLKPDHFWAGCLLAICYVQTTRFEGAKSCLTACLQADPEFAWLYLLRGFASGQLAARYLGLVATSPGREKALKESAEFEFKLAEADLRDALERLDRRPDDDLRYQLLVNRGLIRFQRGRLDEAAADYRQAITLREDPFLALAEMGHVRRKRGDTAGAIEEFTRAIAVRPDWAPLYRGRADVRLGLANPTPDDRKAALADLEMAIRCEKADSSVLARDHTNRGRLLYQDGRLDEAMEECRLALAVLPDHAEAHVLRVQALLKSRRYGEVVRSCDAALAAARKSPLLYELRGDALAAQEDYPAAVQDYSRAIEIRPRDGRLLVRRGWAYLMVDSPRLALADFEAALRHDPAQADACNGRGTARARLGDHRAAVADAREALRLGGASPRITYNAARIYALAAAVASAEVGEKARASRALPSRYQDVAVQLIREALMQEAPEKREPFWRETIRNDPALKGIRRRLRFEELIADNKKASP